ncbi:Cyanovirin-N [Aspergillus keveii]|uniref:Cyanovirin-N n=1 Tax=Aspergillus keveii TaxID=714993 RepID=A0ABR4FUP4_9EURO
MSENFLNSARNVSLQDGRRLVAELQNQNGEYVHAEMYLDDVLGNSEGRFEWGGENFILSARDVRLEFEEDGTQPVLLAILLDENDDLRSAMFYLSERIFNENGAFVFR